MKHYFNISIISNLINNQQFLKIGLFSIDNKEIESNAKTNYNIVVIYSKSFIIKNNKLVLNHSIKFNKPKIDWGCIYYIGIFDDCNNLLMMQELAIPKYIMKNAMDLEIQNLNINIE